jgi:hypothetical protein
LPNPMVITARMKITLGVLWKWTILTQASKSVNDKDRRKEQRLDGCGFGVV